MAATRPFVPAKFEIDLDSPNTVSALWVDSSGQERSLSQVRLLYVPYLIGNEGDDQRCVPLEDVRSIDVDRRKSFWTGDPLTDRWEEETHVVAHWRLAPWGELVRLRPE